MAILKKIAKFLALVVFGYLYYKLFYWLLTKYFGSFIEVLDNRYFFIEHYKPLIIVVAVMLVLVTFGIVYVVYYVSQKNKNREKAD